MELLEISLFAKEGFEMRLMIALFLVSLGSSANGQQSSSAIQYSRISSAGHEYNLSCNSDGYVLNSEYPISRAIGDGANTRYIKGTETIYLGKSCDAFSKVLGAGQWCWANGGILVELAGARIGFPRQELYCRANQELGLGCGCK